MMEWAALVALYPFLKDLATKLPSLRESLESYSKENPVVELQFETIQRTIELQKTIELTGFTSAKLSNPDAQKSDFIKAREWALEVYKAIHET